MTRPGLVGVIGLGRSGRGAAKLALTTGSGVFASDASDGDEVRETASEIRRLGGEAETGGHTVERLARCDLIVLSPGIPPDAAILNDERLADVPWTSELEFASRHLNAPIIAVTGTNGKTTVTAWIAHLLEVAGVDAVAAGNIGTALSEVALREPRAQWVVVEASSYQLGRIDRFTPAVGVVTNLAPDHLDRYPSVAAYYADKAHIFDNATPDSAWVLNAEDADVIALAGDAPGRRYFFRTHSDPDLGEAGGHMDAGGRLVLRVDDGEHVVARPGDLRLLGDHNRANALAAGIAAYAAGVDLEAIREGLKSFAPMRHRLEPVGDIGGVLWINDSKATNVASARVAIESMDRPTVLLLGGRHKGEEYRALAGVISDRVKAVVAFGEAAERIEAALEDATVVVREPGGFEAVVRQARDLAESGDAVLLAPACSSFDMFRDYEDRGRQFERAVRALAGGAAEAARG